MESPQFSYIFVNFTHQDGLMSLSFAVTVAYFFGQSMGRELWVINLIIRSRSGTSNTPDWPIRKQNK